MTQSALAAEQVRRSVLELANGVRPHHDAYLLTSAADRRCLEVGTSTRKRKAGGSADLIRFIKRADIPALPQISIAHTQFETIHPFPDSTGRIGRH
jgi:hypothetical protein